MPDNCAVGIDLVHIPEFAEQFALPGSQFAAPGKVFTSRELRRASLRAQEMGDDPAVHLAAVWALKEAALKAWSSALDARALPQVFTRDQVPWAQFTVHHSPAGAPSLTLVGGSAQALRHSFGADATWQVSVSHDGDYATAIALLSTGE